MFGWLRRLRDDAVRQSREWMIRCTVCGSERSVFEAGGIRYGAWGKKPTSGHCRTCGKRQRMVVYHPTRGPL
jgi:rRNA maturation endonuclease Nob1